MLIIIALIFVVLAFTSFIYMMYKLVRPLRFHAAIRVWLVVFYIELLFLSFIPQGSHFLGIGEIYIHGGIYYLLMFALELNKLLPAMLRGQKPVETLLLLLPLLPALLVFLYTRRHPPSN